MKRKRDGQTWLSRELPVTAADRFADLAHDIQTAPPGVSTLVRTGTHFPAESITTKWGCTVITGTSPYEKPAYHLPLSIETTLENLRSEALAFSSSEISAFPTSVYPFISTSHPTVPPGICIE